ncbi:MAG: hypothetical protein CM1200mP15_04770 [Dehalococcoidia bacterium]|nr:MAG: hypothetical protein CM1200mP15_04770 [Dehalococcoidia bacterium]
MPLIVGGGQERERRSGTENIAAIVGPGNGTQNGRTTLGHSNSEHCMSLRDEIIRRVTQIYHP